MKTGLLSTLVGVGSLLAACAPSSTREAAKTPSPADSRPAGSGLTALDRYLAAPDTNYSFRLVKQAQGKGETTFLLEMTSQSWLATNEVDRTLWKHWLTVVRPDSLESSKSLLFIAGGANGGVEPKGIDGNLVQIAIVTKSVVAELKMVPNQPLRFSGDTEGRVEDSFIAYKAPMPTRRCWPASTLW